MSGNPTTTPPSNVVPMPTNWPGPMFMPKTWPPPGGGPSCFSELASLNACYDSIQMMNQILAKVITDLVTNDAAVQKAIVEAIAASGSNVPLIGVTNGSNAQPGQVGEFAYYTAGGNFATGNNNLTVNAGVLQPGDWDVYGSLNIAGGFQFVNTSLTPVPAGFSSNMGGFMGVVAPSGGADETSLALYYARASITAPTLLVWNLALDAGTNAGGPYSYFIQARRAR